MLEPYVIVSLSVASEHRSAEDIATLMNQPSEWKSRRAPRRPPPWIAYIPTDESLRLQQQLQNIEQYLHDRANTLQSLADCNIHLAITWTPHSPRDHVTISPDFIGLLDGLRCLFILDTSIDRWNADKPDEYPSSDETWWHPILRVDSAGPSDQPWSAEIPTEGVMRLVDSFPQIRAYLEHQVPAPDGYALTIDWQPRVPQDGITLDLELLAVLDRLHCTVTLNTHIEE
jgi:hypothetical protein